MSKKSGWFGQGRMGEARPVPSLQTTMTHKPMCAAADQPDGENHQAAIVKVLARGTRLPDTL